MQKKRDNKRLINCIRLMFELLFSFYYCFDYSNKIGAKRRPWLYPLSQSYDTLSQVYFLSRISVFYRRLTGPAFKGSTEGTLFGKASLEGNFTYCAGGVF